MTAGDEAINKSDEDQMHNHQDEETCNCNSCGLHHGPRYTGEVTSHLYWAWLAGSGKREHPLGLNTTERSHFYHLPNNY